MNLLETMESFCSLYSSLSCHCQFYPLASTLSPEALSSFFRVFSSIEDFLVPLRPQGLLGGKSLKTSLSYQQGCNSLKNRTGDALAEDPSPSSYIMNHL